MVREMPQPGVNRPCCHMKRKKADDDFLHEVLWQVCVATWLIIFDGEARLGEVAQAFTQDPPSSCLYCFEPFAKSFAILKEQSSPYPQTNLTNAGLSDSSGVEQFNVNLASSTNLLLVQDSRAATNLSHSGLISCQQEAYQVYKLYEFHKKQDIESIELLRINDWVAEYSVLQGGVS